MDWARCQTYSPALPLKRCPVAVTLPVTLGEGAPFFGELWTAVPITLLHPSPCSSRLEAQGTVVEAEEHLVQFSGGTGEEREGGRGGVGLSFSGYCSSSAPDRGGSSVGWPKPLGDVAGRLAASSLLDRLLLLVLSQA